MISPQSCTQTSLRIRATPVSTSTSTSANCTPLVPTDDSPSSHPPSTVIDAVPSCLQASRQLMPFDGSSLTCTRPPDAVMVAGSTPSAGATLSASAASAFSQTTPAGGVTD